MEFDLDQLLNERLANHFAQEAAEQAQRDLNRAERIAKRNRHLEQIVKQAFDLDLVADNECINIGGYVLHLENLDGRSLQRFRLTHPDLKFTDYGMDAYVTAGFGNDTLKLDNRDAFLLSFQRGKAQLDQWRTERQKPEPEPAPLLELPKPDPRLQAVLDNAIAKKQAEDAREAAEQAAALKTEVDRRVRLLQVFVKEALGIEDAVVENDTLVIGNYTLAVSHLSGKATSISVNVTKAGASEWIEQGFAFNVAYDAETDNSPHLMNKEYALANFERCLLDIEFDVKRVEAVRANDEAKKADAVELPYETQRVIRDFGWIIDQLQKGQRLDMFQRAIVNTAQYMADLEDTFDSH